MSVADVAAKPLTASAARFSRRCVFHAFNKFPDETVEGTMMVMKLRDGKCYHVETGSTLIPKDSPNYIG